MAQMLRKQLEEEDRREEEAEARNDNDHKMGKQILAAWLKIQNSDQIDISFEKVFPLLKLRTNENRSFQNLAKISKKKSPSL